MRERVWYMSRGKRRQKQKNHNTKFHLFWVGRLIFFSLESLALNPICAFCQLCPRVPCGVMGGKKKLQMADKHSVLRLGKTDTSHVGMSFIWIKGGQIWLYYSTAIGIFLVIKWIKIRWFGSLVTSISQYVYISCLHLSDNVFLPYRSVVTTV